jgi:acetyltransferase-like isoleucine patch superfamily enzyme
MKNVFSTFVKLLRGLFRAKQFCFIGENVRLGKNVRIGLCTSIEDYCTIGDNTFIGNGCTIRPSSNIGNDCSFGHLTVIEGWCWIGDRVSFHAQCHITKGTVIEDDVFIAPFYLGTNTRRIDHGRGLNPPIEAPTIKRAARIGAGVIILPGVTVGENALIGSGSIVTKDVPDNEVWFGSPAKSKGPVPEEEKL